MGPGQKFVTRVGSGHVRVKISSVGVKENQATMFCNFFLKKLTWLVDEFEDAEHEVRVGNSSSVA